MQLFSNFNELFYLIVIALAELHLEVHKQNFMYLYRLNYRLVTFKQIYLFAQNFNNNGQIIVMGGK